MKPIYYKQCTLKRGNLFTTSWLPERFAKINKYLRLKDEDGWKVTYVGSTRLSEEEINKRSQDYKQQRNFSDIYREKKEKKSRKLLLITPK